MTQHVGELERWVYGDRRGDAGTSVEALVGAGTRASAALPRDAAPSLSKVVLQAFMGGAGAEPLRGSGRGRVKQRVK